MGPKRIRDPIHGYLALEAGVVGVVDSPAVQRLRRVRQLGTANLVYPGANHTRFEHALGACHLGGLAAQHLGLSEQEAADLRLALLLHDVGHGPFSHLSEPAMRRSLGVGHKDLSMRLVLGELRDQVEAAGARPEAVARMIDGKGELGGLVSGDLDLDRMDYLVRDAHYTGVNVGVDLERLLAGLARRPGGGQLRQDARHRGVVALREDALQAAEILLVARFLMYTTVYYHHAARIAEGMVARGIDLALAAGEVEGGALARMDDGQLLQALRTSRTPAAELVERLERRQLLKTALALGAPEAGPPAARLREDEAARRALEAELAAEAGCAAWEVVVDLPELPVVEEVRAPVLAADGGVRSLSERSALVASLHRAQLDHWRLRVYGPARVREALGQAARRALAGLAPPQP